MRYTDELADEIATRHEVPESVREAWKHWQWIPDRNAIGARKRTPLTRPEDRVVWQRTTRVVRSAKISRDAVPAAAEIPEGHGLRMLAEKTAPGLEEMAALQYQISMLRVAAQEAEEALR